MIGNMPRCSREDRTCISCKNGKCIALSNTEFEYKDGSEKACPFYKDKTKMSENEIKDYEKLVGFDTRKK